MRYAVISDIHSNIQALKAVFRDIADQRIDRVISLGDVVGYGPNPTEVIDLLSDVVSDAVLGNHDAAVAGYFPVDKFNSEACRAIEWTTSVITERELEFLRKQPLEIIFENSTIYKTVEKVEVKIDKIFVMWKEIPEIIKASEFNTLIIYDGGNVLEQYSSYCGKIERYNYNLR